MQAVNQASQYAHETAQKVGEAADEADQKLQDATMTAMGMKSEFGSMTGLMKAMMKETAAGQVSIQRMQDYIVAFVVIGVVGAAGLLILGSMQEDATVENNTEASEGISNAIQGITELLGFLPTIGLVVAAVIIISLLAGFQLGRGGGGQRRRA